MADEQRAVSVIIAAKNAEATIGRAVASALAQPETAEVIVVDDGSSDRTAETALAAASGDRLRLLRFDSNRGPSAARNRAIDAATAPFIAILDADDHLLAGRLRGLIAHVDPSDDLVADDVLIADAAAPLIPRNHLCGDVPAGGMLLDIVTFADGNLGRGDRRELGFLKPLIRRERLAGLRYHEGLRLGEDYVFYVSALSRGLRFKLVPACGYVAVRSTRSLSGRHDTADLQAFFEQCARLARLPGLTSPERRALWRHAVSIRRRFEHRRVLDARRSKGLIAAIGDLPWHPGDLAYIVRETLATKLSRLF